VERAAAGKAKPQAYPREREAASLRTGSGHGFRKSSRRKSADRAHDHGTGNLRATGAPIFRFWLPKHNAAPPSYTLSLPAENGASRVPPSPGFGSRQSRPLPSAEAATAALQEEICFQLHRCRVGCESGVDLASGGGPRSARLDRQRAASRAIHVTRTGLQWHRWPGRQLHLSLGPESHAPTGKQHRRGPRDHQLQTIGVC